MNKTLLQIFTWWNGATLGTRFAIWRRGEFVGTDEFGNTYYRERGPGGRRWVMYAGEAEASSVPPGWRGWLEYTWDEAPSDKPHAEREWELPHRSNPTGTPNAYRPKGSTLNVGHRPKVAGDYEAWSPGE